MILERFDKLLTLKLVKYFLPAIQTLFGGRGSWNGLNESEITRLRKDKDELDVLIYNMADDFFDFDHVHPDLDSFCNDSKIKVFYSLVEKKWILLKHRLFSGETVWVRNVDVVQYGNSIQHLVKKTLQIFTLVYAGDKSTRNDLVQKAITMSALYNDKPNSYQETSSL
jgi:hypothetical protein